MATKSKFEAVVRDSVVWSDEFKDGSFRNFPEEYRRPAVGERVDLYINDELVAVQEGTE